MHWVTWNTELFIEDKFRELPILASSIWLYISAC